MNHSTLSILSLLGLTLSLSPPAGAQEQRFFWFDTARAHSEDEIGRVHECGFTGVVFPAFVEGETRYSSRLLPNPAAPEGLEESLDACRRLGLSVGVLFQCFIHGGDLGLGHHLAARYPEWISYRYDGISFLAALEKRKSLKAGLDGVFFDPGIPRFTELLLGLLSESLDTFDPDWAILDQVRYPIPDSRFADDSGRGDQPFGFHPATRSAFQSVLGVDPATIASGDLEESKEQDLLRDWNRWRTDLLDEFLKSAREVILRRDPRCKIAAAGYPDPRLARELALQDWPNWIRRNQVDRVVLPDNDASGQTSSTLDLLPEDLRERIWLSGSMGEDGGDTLAIERTLERLTRGNGVLLFDPKPLTEDSVEPIRAAWRDPDAVPVVYREPEAPIEKPEVPVRDSLESPPTADSDTSAHPGIVALYGFEPHEPPFVGLTPNQTVDRLHEYGFNAVFGGSEDGPMRRALDVGGIERFEDVPLFVGERNWKRRPESQPIAKNGKALKKTEWYAPVCPNQPWLQTEKLERLLRHVMERNLRGVWLDFVRYPLYWEEVPPFLAETCFCPECLKQFQADTGIVVEGAETWEKAEWILANKDAEWRRWRGDALLNYVESVKNEVKKISPDTLVGAFVLPWSEEENDAALYRIAGQDLRGFAERVDVLSPMLYFHQLGKSPEWVADRIASLSRNLGCPILPIVQCYDQPTAIPPPMLEAALKNSLLPPSNGTILFSQRHLETGAKWGWIASVLSTSRMKP